MARITTVLGDIAPEDLGFTSMHDHSVVSLRQAGEYMQQMFSFKDPETLTFIPENYVNIKDGSFLANPELWVTDDVDLLAKEFGFFKALGGQSVLDPTPSGMRAGIEKVRELSQKTGLNFIVATGFYHETTIPPEHMGKGENHFYQFIKNEFENGIEGTDVRPGAVKCALSNILENEVDSLNASFHLAADTGMLVCVHTEPTTPGDELIETLEAAVERYGVSREKINVCHMDSPLAASVMPMDYLQNEEIDRTLNLELQRALLGRGYNIGLDTWSLPVNNPFFFTPDLWERTKALVLLCQDGFAGQITLGNDFSCKIGMRTYGEWGPTAAFAFGCQRLLELGHADWVHTLTVETPARLLAY
jgi:phosphotriesterase-related protein